MSPTRLFRPPVDRRDAALPFLVLAAGLLASLAAAAGFWRVAEMKDRERFEHAIVQTQGAIVGRLDTYVAVLQAGAGLFAASSTGVTRREFSAFAARLRLRERYPGIQGIGFSRYVRPGEADDVVAAMRAEGLGDFRITPAGPRPELHTIIHLEPLDRRNRAAIGYDMYSNPVRREAMARARDTGRTSMSGKVELVQEIDRQKQAGFLIYVPVYDGDPAVLPATVAERRARLAGFVYAPFRADDLLAGIFGDTPRRRVDFAIYDGPPEPANLLYRTGDAATAADAAYRATRSLRFRGRDWTVLYASRPILDAGSSRMLAPLVFLVGALASTTVGWVVWLQVKARRRADASAAAHAASETHLQLLVNELNHRVKNTLATVQSLIWQTLRSTDLNEEIRNRLDARIMALSAAHNVLTRENWESASLRDIADEALAPFRGATAGRLSVEGPPLRVAPRAALAIAMALHELATNALKYGALSNDAGHVELRWEPVGEDRLRLSWRERGGPPVARPVRKGFGSRLIERGLAHDLGGSVRIDYDPAGVVCVADAIKTA